MPPPPKQPVIPLSGQELQVSAVAVHVLFDESQLYVVPVVSQWDQILAIA